MQINLFYKKECPESVLNQIPILRQIRRLMEIIDDTGGIKISSAGYLPVKIVEELYPLGAPDYWVESGYFKSLREDKVDSIQIMHFIAKASGVVRLYKGKLLLTKKGRDLIHDPATLFILIFDTICFRVDVGGMDGYKIKNINQYIPILCLMLAYYGSEPKEDTFYSKKIFSYVPDILPIDIENNHNMVDRYTRCLSVRMITRGLRLFGLADCIEGKYNAKTNNIYPDMVVKKPLFDDVFEMKITEKGESLTDLEKVFCIVMLTLPDSY